MNQSILMILTQTPTHVGGGEASGYIDNPIQRERHTGHPIFQSGGMKGVFRKEFLESTPRPLSGEDRALRTSWFGTEEGDDGKPMAGHLSFVEARTLAFPLRSAAGAFAWITCPKALSGFASVCTSAPAIPQEPEEMSCQAGKKVSWNNHVVLEEYRFTHTAPFPEEWERFLSALVSDHPVWNSEQVAGRLVLLSNEDFSHFVTTACEISHHNRIDPKTGIVKDGALFTIESLPADTLMYAAVVDSRGNGAITGLTQLLHSTPVLQFGGDKSTGRGFCRVSVFSPSAN